MPQYYVTIIIYVEISYKSYEMWKCKYTKLQTYTIKDNNTTAKSQQLTGQFSYDPLFLKRRWWVISTLKQQQKQSQPLQQSTRLA